MKNTLKIVAIAALLLVCCAALAACGKCKHKNVEWVVTVEATCSVAGTKAQTCVDCGEVVKTEQYETDHQYQVGYCLFCGKAKYGSEYLQYGEITLGGVTGYELVGVGNSTATDLVIPALKNGKPVLSVAEGAFAGNKNITSVSFGPNVVQIGNHAFADCPALATVTFHEKSELQLLGISAFAGCTALTAFVFPVGVEAIPAALFEGCTSLEEVVLHDGIFSLGEGAFSDCAAIAYAERGGAKYLGTAQTPHLLLAGLTDKTVTSFEVPADTRIIGAEAFSGCTALATVTLPEGVRSLGAYAFAGCTSLSSVTLPASLQKIEAYAFAECTVLSELSVPAATATIGERAFYKCTSLTAISLPNGIETLGALAFYDAAITPLSHEGGLYLGNAENPYLVLIGVEADAVSLTVHEDTRVIADSALSGASLASLHVGAGVVTLGARALDGCTALTAVTFAVTEGWQRAATRGVGAVSVTVSDAAANAAALTGLYKYDCWYR
ncbi:MAG: leucine-rich repeat domain-containing protein [Clostridia bacterium]|nr:leucine-rich repeat domain-containing protein [Clostridia bacterium]